jgi:trans-2,3-dihydro-3-hydroxyanthranilate isomerase
MSRPYAILDVFTDRPLAGNPLAVVLESGGLDDAAMQAIAREFNLPETVFVAPPERPMHSARIRIFTPERELPFAGHPTVGTAVLLARRAAGGDPNRHEMVLVLEEGVGPVRCGVALKGRAGGRAIFDLPRSAVEAGSGADREKLAAALGLNPAEIGFENHQPSVFAAGNAFAFVPVRGLDVIAQARPNLGAWKAAFGEGVIGAYLYCRQTVATGRHFHARSFLPFSGIFEDAASGSAVAAFSGAVRRFDAPPSGSHHFVIEQGFEMGRPSLISLEIDIEDGQIVGSRVGGDAVVVAEGELDV